VGGFMEDNNDKIETIRVTDENGLEREAEVLSFFKLKSNDKEYLIYTFNEPAGDDLVTIHASTVQVNADGTYTLLGIDDENEWTEVKKVMRDIIKNSKE
jgi:uncharacterized protein YrzB (UPF0473 family)